MGHFKDVDHKRVERILVCIFKYHGDVLLTSPIYTVLRRAFPKSKIDVYLFKDTQAMLDGHKCIDEFITYDQKWRKKFWPIRIFHELVMWKKIRSRKYDLVINMTSGDRGAIITKVSNAPIRVGIEPEGGLMGKSKFFTHLLRITTTNRHIVERNLDSLRAIGILPKVGTERDLVFEIPQKAYEKVESLIPYDEYVLIHPASRCSFKHWTAEKFAKLILYLKNRGENIVISGGPGKAEQLFINQIIEFLGNEEVLNLSGQTNLKELGALVDQSKLLISVDSMPPHIASALKKPVVVLFGPSNDIKWGPWQNPLGRVVRLDVPCKRCDHEGCGGTWVSDCLDNLSTSAVINEVDKALGKITSPFAVL